MTWRSRSACADMAPDLFAPWGINDVSLAALAACQSCPVREVCHDTAHAEGFDQWTIHGGELPHQWAFKGATVANCGHCDRPLVIGARADADAPFCNNRCRFRAYAERLRREHGQVTLFDLEATG